MIPFYRTAAIHRDAKRDQIAPDTWCTPRNRRETVQEHDNRSTSFAGRNGGAPRSHRPAIFSLYSGTARGIASHMGLTVEKHPWNLNRLIPA
jgi:hypothetical protein